MPNLYITKNNTKTVMGLTPERKTTPSLVVTCGATTYYGSLTTDIKQATEPNKLVVTSGSTTYYTMAPAIGTKYVNFITPRECSAIEGTVMAKCCAGIAGYKDRLRSTIEGVTRTSYGSIGQCCLGNVTASCKKSLLMYNSPDTTIEHCYVYYTPLDHTHNTSIVFDDSFSYGCMSASTRHKGVRVCKNYSSSPDFIYVGCGISGVTRGNLNYDFLCINGVDNNISRSMICMPFTCIPGGKWPSGNTSLVESEIREFSSIAAGPTTAAVGLRFDNLGHVRHTHIPDTPTSCCIYDNLIGCYCAGWGMPWFGVNMKCYNNDIDKLPKGSILFTDCDISCFNSKYWEQIDLGRYCDMNLAGTQCKLYYETYPYVNGTFGNNYNISYQLCWKPYNYDRQFVRHKSDCFGSIPAWPLCSGSVGNCTYVPIADTWHYHITPNGALYVCVNASSEPQFTYYTLEIVGCKPIPGGPSVPVTGMVPHYCKMNAPNNYMAVNIASPGMCAIIHK